MKKILPLLFITLLLNFSNGSLTAQTVNNFPYYMDFSEHTPQITGENTTSLQGWTTLLWEYKGNSIVEGPTDIGGYYLNYNVGSAANHKPNYIISPLLDLSGLEKPTLSYTQRTYTSVYISKSGTQDENFTLLQTSNIQYRNLVELDKDVRYVKFAIDYSTSTRNRAFSLNNILIYDDKTETPISHFPWIQSFELPESLCDWKGAAFHRFPASEEDKNFVDGEYVLYLYNVPSGINKLTTPTLDLSGLEYPDMRLYVRNGNYRFTFTDNEGVSSNSLTYNNSTPGYMRVTGLSKSIKTIEFSTYPNGSFIDHIIIKDAATQSPLDKNMTMVNYGMLKWVAENNSYKLRFGEECNNNNIAQLVYFNPELKDMPSDGEYELTFTLKGVDKDKVTLRFNNTNTYNTDGTYTVSLKQSSTYNFTATLLANVAAEEIPEIVISDLKVKSYFSRFPHNGLFYDLDGDGVKEFIKPVTASGNKHLIAYKYEDGRYHPTDTIIPYFMQNVSIDLSKTSIYNINNDEYPDFGVPLQVPEKPSGVYISDGGYKYNKVENVHPQQWDINNDGRPDLYSMPNLSNRYEKYIHLQNADGSFTKTQMDLVSYNSLNDSTIYEHWGYLGSDGPFDASGIPSLRTGMFIGSGMSYANMDKLTVEIDLNKDGLPDLLDVSIGGVLYNLGDNKFVAGAHSGAITVKDLNGDFITDFIIYDSKAQTVTTIVYEGEGKFKEQLLIKNLSISNIYCYDFDKDGDMDILLTFDYTNQSKYAYLVLCENDGKGNFKIHEQYYPEEYAFKLCADIDNDGYYDVIGIREISTDNNIYLFKGKSGMAFEDPLIITTSKSDTKNITFELQDFNNDGVYELAMDANRGTLIHSFENVTPNSAPRKMNSPRYVLDQQSGTLRILWDAATDKETSSVDLSYALRIGTQPGSGDVFYAHAYADGTRRNFAPGNVGSNLDKIFNVNGWSVGNYYIAVQAIDPMYKGSEWSDEIIYTHSMISGEFDLSSKDFSITDTLTVTLAGATNASYSYHWDLADGKIIETNADRSVLKVVFDRHGDKTLSLQVSDGSGNFSSQYEREIVVRSGKFELTDYDSYNPGYGYVFDMDGDGVAELVTNNGIYINDGNYEFSKLPKVYNTDLVLGGAYAIDFNMDGMPDIVSYTTKGNVFLNQGEMNFDIQTELFTKINSSGQSSSEYYVPELANNNHYKSGISLYDFNNDGYFDLYERGVVYLNQRDNKTFIQSGTVPNSPYLWVDLNRDGYLDCIGRSYSSPYKITVYINQGDFTFKSTELEYESNLDLEILVHDMNNDGYPDIIMKKNEKTITILPGSKEFDYKESIDIHLPLGDFTLGYVYTRNLYDVRDFDNNGYLDLLLKVKDNVLSSSEAILYFYPNFETELRLLFTKESPTYYTDLNGDGIPDYLSSNYLYKHHSNIKNSAPETPKNLRATQTETGLLIKWDAAYDLETPFTQMRYNLSVKKKGASGDNSFIISPMNGLKDSAIPIPNYSYLRIPQMEIPMDRVPAGEYEIQVQSIDLWDAHSPMSSPITIETTAQLSILVPLEACINEPVTVRYSGSEPTSANFVWDWDGGTVISGSNSGPYSVKWDKPGVKTIKVTANGISSSSNVLISEGESLDLDFTLPQYALAGTEVLFELPVMAMNPDVNYHFEKSNTGINISRKTGTREAKVVFPTEGSHWIEFCVETGTCGAVTYRQNIEVKATLPTPQITIVTIDEETGKNKISWNPDNINLTSEITEVMVYKEGNRYNQFTLLGTVNPKTGYFIDYTSNPQVTTARYRLTLNSIYGAESNPGTIHKSTHLLLNKGMGGAINLVWTQYEGGTIDSYRIYRGTSEDNMKLLTEVAGSVNTYTDLTPPEGLFYYAIEYDQLYNDDWSVMSKARAQSKGISIKSGRSNLVSVVNAQNITLVESIAVLAVEEQMELTPEQKELHLYTEVMPVLADYKNVNWLVVEGEEIAYVNSRGLLTARGEGNGQVRVRAMAIDGSNIYKDIYVPVQGFNEVSVEEVNVDKANILLYPNPVRDVLYIRNVDSSQTPVTVTIFNLQGQIMMNMEFPIAGSEIAVPVNRLSQDIYFIKIDTDDYSLTKKFLKK